MRWLNLVVVLTLVGCGSDVGKKNPAVAENSNTRGGDAGQRDMRPADAATAMDVGLADHGSNPDFGYSDLPELDMGRDTGVDAGWDAGSDVGADAGLDAGLDAGSDAGTDADMFVNTPPTVSSASISPGSPAQPGALLTCNYVFDDVDGDADMSLVEWLVGGTVVATGETFSAYGPQETVRCRVTPRDGESSGAPVTSSPVVAPAGATVSAGYGHTCVLTAMGGVRCWGENFDGRVGSNTSTNGGSYIPPTTPAGLGSGVTQVAAGGLVSCAIQSGSVKCWGSGAWGVIGPGVSTDTVTPTTIITSGVTQIATGEVHVCAIQNGALVCWGANDHGQLGNTVGINETFGSNDTPTVATGLSSGVSKVATGQLHTCVIQNGGLKCFGYNAFGQLGNDDNLDPDIANPVPTTVPGLGSGVTDVVAGRYHTCAVHNGNLKCWGNAQDGQLGYVSANTFESTPTTVPTLAGSFDALAAGGDNVCVVQNRALKCWGDNVYDQLLASTPGGSVITPTTILQPAIGSISVGDSHICAERNGDMYCWGDNYNGQVGTAVGFGMFAPLAPMIVTY